FDLAELANATLAEVTAAVLRQLETTPEPSPRDALVALGDTPTWVRRFAMRRHPAPLVATGIDWAGARTCVLAPEDDPWAATLVDALERRGATVSSHTFEGVDDAVLAADRIVVLLDDGAGDDTARVDRIVTQLACCAHALPRAASDRERPTAIAVVE